jgi:hypothetical protein
MQARLRKEFQKMQQEPTEGIEAAPLEKNILVLLPLLSSSITSPHVPCVGVHPHNQ